jgi:hypothetical protein
VLERGRRLVVVLDALDEAEEPQRVTREVLRPLAADAGGIGVRVLVGTRRELLHLLRTSTVILDVDAKPYLELDDLVTYVYRCLLLEHDPTQTTPYTDNPALAATVARAVAVRAHPTFLIARLVSRSLVEAGAPVDVGEPGWREQFPDSVAAAMDDYLARFGALERRVRELLAPLAWAEGRGLPADTLWPQLATAVAGTRYQDEDVRWLLGTAATSYLLESTEADGQTSSGATRLHWLPASQSAQMVARTGRPHTSTSNGTSPPMPQQRASWTGSSKTPATC